MDLYTLYVGKQQQEQVPPEYVSSVTTMPVDDAILEPSVWVECIQWSRYRRQGETKCLEVFVRRPCQSQLYYAVGMEGTILMNETDFIQIHPSTVEILCGESKLSCLNPRVLWVDGKKIRHVAG